MRLYLPAIHGGLAAEPTTEPVVTPEARDLLSAIQGHPEQRRQAFTLHTTLTRVAQARADDLAARDYFSHVDPDGYGPNWHVRRAGYPLPWWYGIDEDGIVSIAANQVESIHGGGVDVAEVMDGWLNSPSHKRQVLGLLDFYADQTDVGAGHTGVEGTTYLHYWVFISAMAE